MANPDSMPRFHHRGLRAQAFADTYHWMIGLGWTAFLGMLTLGFVLFNLLFATLYMVGGDCYHADDPSSFLQAFSFSVQTMASIGYGAMYPTTPYAHVISILEGFLALLAIAMSTGLVFAKFSRPISKVGFARHPVILKMDGANTLQIRLSNLRHSQVVDARVQAVALITTVSEEGHSMRRIMDLELARDTSPIFAVSWTLMHTIDETSPLYNGGNGRLPATMGSLIINFVGLDDMFSQTVHAQHLYRPEDFRFDQRYRDMMITRADGTIEIDHARLHDIESA